MLHLYLDSADLSTLRPLLASGCFAGVTTNPTLLRAAGVGREDLPGFVQAVTSAGAGTVFLQTWGASAAELTVTGRALTALAEHTVVKVPLTGPGLKAATTLEAEGIPVLLTAVYNAHQVLAVAAAGVSYLAPYLGRMRDAGRDAVAEVATMQQALAAVGSRARILAASIRDAADALSLARCGVRDLTISPGLWPTLFSDALTDDAVAVFEQAASAL